MLTIFKRLHRCAPLSRTGLLGSMATLLLSASLLASLSTSPVRAQDRISAVHAFPASLVYSRSFLEFVKNANEAGKGVFEIQVRGGPEAIGMIEQPPAARDGVVDMVYTACAFYSSIVPECDEIGRAHV